MAELATGIVSNPDLMDGEPVIAGTRVRVTTLYHAAEKTGLAPETIAKRYSISKADVFRALAYYYDHPDEMAHHERVRQNLKEWALDSGAKTLGDLRRENSDLDADQSSI